MISMGKLATCCQRERRLHGSKLSCHPVLNYGILETNERNPAAVTSERQAPDACQSHLWIGHPWARDSHVFPLLGELLHESAFLVVSSSKHVFAGTAPHLKSVEGPAEPIRIGWLVNHSARDISFCAENEYPIGHPKNLELPTG